ncbi:Pleckstrin like proteiny domain-containing family A member 2 [Myotis brandtii]|uniref:Pleckstrin like proteiny domain-containing family A member 2 n=1 Tax=Myotis brandtii TaxID=109478 RepID=S7MD26_MYOBR|nr:Pleckstrin like proteiny domain-containing family A member 2 [Myotis brandtii]
MPYVDRQNRICGFLDIEENENSGKFLRRYFILDTQANYLLWYMDNPQVPKVGNLPLTTEVLKSLAAPPALEKKPQVAYKTEIIGGVVVHTPINQVLGLGCQGSWGCVVPCVPVCTEDYTEDRVDGARQSHMDNGGDGQEGGEPGSHAILRRSQSYIPTTGCRVPTGHPFIKSGYCVKQGNVRKSWKRRFFALDDFSICYFKCEQDREPLRTILLKDVLKTHECLDREPLRTIFLKDVLKTHECLVKSGDLLMRDNLFEIITSSRTFYVQADSPEDMHSWIKEIRAAVQALKCHPREMSFSRSISLTRSGSSSLSGGPNSVFCRGRPPVEEKKALCKAPSVASSWQPWTPVPQAGEKLHPPEETLEDSLFTSRLGESNTSGALPSSRIRHRSEPQHPKEKPFMFNLDDENIRTSDV